MKRVLVLVAALVMCAGVAFAQVCISLWQDGDDVLLRAFVDGEEQPIMHLNLWDVDMFDWDGEIPAVLEGGMEFDDIPDGFHVEWGEDWDYFEIFDGILFNGEEPSGQWIEAIEAGGWGEEDCGPQVPSMYCIVMSPDDAGAGDTLMVTLFVDGLVSELEEDLGESPESRIGEIFAIDLGGGHTFIDEDETGTPVNPASIAITSDVLSEATQFVVTIGWEEVETDPETWADPWEPEYEWVPVERDLTPGDWTNLSNFIGERIVGGGCPDFGAEIDGPHKAEVGDDVVLRCVRQGIPLSEIAGYQWTRDGADIQTTQNLNLNNIQLDKTGYYTILVETNEWGDFESEEHYLRVYPLGQMPLAGDLELGLLAGACALVGAVSATGKNPCRQR